MPLGNTRDSYQNLKNLAHAQYDPAIASHNELQSPLEESSFIAEKKSPTSTYDEESWWELGHDVAKYESDFYGTKKKRSTKKNDCKVGCFWAPWFSEEETDSDDENCDENSDDFPHLERVDSHREGGILKRSSIEVQITPGVDQSQRRTYNPSDFHEHPHQKCVVHFSNPIGKMVAIQPFFTMTPEERKEIWWQQSDFEAFKLELKLLMNSKQLGGCEVWLGDEATQQEKSSKWYKKFGHSRRGLERYLSQEQKEVENSKHLALTMVLNEQRKRRRSKNKDEQIAERYKEFTAWSRNLALAAAASDADAVKTDFDDAKRKTREYYLAKQAILSGGSSFSDHHTPSFMIPSGLPKGSLTKSCPKTVANNAPPKRSGSVAKKAAGFGNSENVGSMMSAINVATRSGAQESARPELRRMKQ